MRGHLFLCMQNLVSAPNRVRSFSQERTFRYPGGFVRQDPKHIRVWASKEDPPSAEYWKPHARDRQMHVEKAPSTVFLDPGLLQSALQNH